MAWIQLANTETLKPGDVIWVSGPKPDFSQITDDRTSKPAWLVVHYPYPLTRYIQNSHGRDTATAWRKFEEGVTAIAPIAKPAPANRRAGVKFYPGWYALKTTDKIHKDDVILYIPDSHYTPESPYAKGPSYHGLIPAESWCVENQKFYVPYRKTTTPFSGPDDVGVSRSAPTELHPFHSSPSPLP